jgi:GT2 family glycosyltransferase
MKQKVCVILVNYFGSKDTAKCLESLQASEEPVQVVVVDNSPNDPELAQVLKNFPETHLIDAPENLGFGKGNNLGIDWALAHTSCEYIFILNNDAMVKPDTITCLMQAMEEHPEAGITVPRIVLAEHPDKLWYGGGEVDWKRGAAIAPGVQGASDADLALTSRFVSFATGCAMFFRREVLEKEKGFSSRFFMYEEDLELSLRVQESGWKIWYDHKALVSHIGQGSTRDDSEFMSLWSPLNPKLDFYVYHMVRNRLLNGYIHANGLNRIKFWLFFPLLCVFKSLQFVKHARWDGNRAMVKAWGSFIQEVLK